MVRVNFCTFTLKKRIPPWNLVRSWASWAGANQWLVRCCWCWLRCCQGQPGTNQRCITLTSGRMSFKTTLPKTNSSHLEMDGWETILSFWDPAYFSGFELLVSGRALSGCWPWNFIHPRLRAGISSISRNHVWASHNRKRINMQLGMPELNFGHTWWCSGKFHAWWDL